jgi:Flp pilus assembly protein TadB
MTKEPPGGKIKEKQAENLWETIQVDGLSYRVQIVSPESHDQAVNGERGRARKQKSLLVVLLIAILVVVALVSIFSIKQKSLLVVLLIAILVVVALVSIFSILRTLLHK